MSDKNQFLAKDTSSSAIFYNVDLDLRETCDSKCLSNSGKGGFLCLAAFSGLHVKCITQFGNTLLYYSCNKHNVLFPKFFCALLKLMSSECDLDYWGQCLANKITHFSTVSFFFPFLFLFLIYLMTYDMTHSLTFNFEILQNISNRCKIPKIWHWKSRQLFGKENFTLRLNKQCCSK